MKIEPHFSGSLAPRLFLAEEPGCIVGSNLIVEVIDVPLWSTERLNNGCLHYNQSKSNNW